MPDLSCACPLLGTPATCSNPATQEDLLCDACRAASLTHGAGHAVTYDPPSMRDEWRGPHFNFFGGVLDVTRL